MTGLSQADPSGSRMVQAVSRCIFPMLRGLLICSVVASLLFNRDFSDGSHDWWRETTTPANGRVKKQRVHCRFTAVSALFAVTACAVSMKVTQNGALGHFCHLLLSLFACTVWLMRLHVVPVTSKPEHHSCRPVFTCHFLSCSLVLFFLNSEYYLFKVTHCHLGASINLILQAGRGNGLCIEKNPTFYEVRVNFKAACPTHQQPTMDGVYTSQLLLAWQEF